MVATITFSGNLYDFASQARPELHPELRFIPSGPGAASNQILFGVVEVVTPTTSGAFSVSLAITENLTPDVFYRLNIRWLDADNNFRGEDNPQWQLRVPVGASSLADLIEASSPTLTIESATRPTGAYAYWLNTTNGDLYKWSGGNYVLITNIKGPEGEQGPEGPAGPASAEGLLTDDAIAENMKNRETKTSTETTALVVEVVAATAPAEVWIYNGGNIATPRPNTSGKVKWFSAVGYPTNLDATKGDVYYAISVDPLSFSPLHRKGLFGWLDPRKSGYANGAAMPTYPEQGPQKLTLTQWAISGSGATQTPAQAAAGLGGTPAVNYISRSGHTTPISVPAPACVVLAMNCQFTGAAPATLNQHANSMGDTGKYSIQRTPAGTWAASIDGVTDYNFGTSDSNPHSWVLVATPTRLRVWLDGNLALDQEVALPSLPIASVFRFGYVGTTLGLAMGGGMIGDAYAYAPAAAPTSSDVSIDTQWLKARRGV